MLRLSQGIDGSEMEISKLESSPVPHCEYINRFLQTEEYIHTLKLTNFSTRFFASLRKQRYQIDNEGESTAWRITIFTDISDKAYENYLSLECLFKKVNLNIENDPNFLVIYFIDKSGQEVEIFKELLYDSDGKDECHWIIKKFIKIKSLLDLEDELLPNGTLTIRFKIYFPFEELDLDSTNNPKRINFGFENLLNNEEFSDVKIVIGDKVLFANKCIVAYQSDVFKAMFRHNMKESRDNTVVITDFSYEVVQEMLHFLYTGKVKDIKDIAVDLFLASDKYQLSNLKNICERVLIDDLSVSNVIALLKFAEDYGARILRKRALKFFQLHAKDIVQTKLYSKDMSSLSPLLLSDMIKSLVTYYDKS